MNKDNCTKKVDDLNNSVQNLKSSTTTIVNSSGTQSTSSKLSDDEELLKAFIGNNYEKITTKSFNFAGFFFTTFYMFYRKMFLYAIILFIVNFVAINLINNIIINLVFNVFVGIFINKIYIFYAKKKIEKVKAKNQQKDINELKSICTDKGGTSVGKIFLGLLLELGISFVVILIMFAVGINSVFDNLFNLGNLKNINNDSASTEATPKGFVAIKGYRCSDRCYVYIGKSDYSSDYDEYVFDADNYELFTALDDYSNYVDIFIWYIDKIWNEKKGNEKTIVDYKIFYKSNNNEKTSENINAKTEDELRSKLGLYTYGTHTEQLTLKEIGEPGIDASISMDNGESSYVEYENYTFIDSKNNEYVMKYVIPEGKSGLNLNETYNITFEVIKDTFGKDKFIIKNVN